MVTSAPSAGLRHQLAERGIDPLLSLVVPALLFVAALFFYPFLYGLNLSFHPLKAAPGLANYVAFFTDPYQRDTIATTLWIALPATLVNVLASIPIAYLLRKPF